jgi:hypothetical protein
MYDIGTCAFCTIGEYTSLSFVGPYKIIEQNVGQK